MSVNIGSVMAKVRAYANSPAGKAKMNKVLDKYRAQGIKVTQAGDEVVDLDKMTEAGQKLIQVLRETAQSHDLSESVLALFGGLSATPPLMCGANLYKIHINLPGGTYRPSLFPENYGGIVNIVAVLNNGYNARNFVYTKKDSDSKYLRSMKDRQGLHFMQEAVAKFNSTYGAVYDVTATVGDIYR